MTAEQKKKSKEFLGKLHDKYYSKKKSKGQAAKAKDKPEAPKTKSPTRHELMMQAKDKGVKNYRVINKEELLEILKEGTTQERINEIVNAAVARWKAGWGKGKTRKKNEDKSQA
jgi:hypothetical protein